jgi:CarD family transcriptional regulator
MKTGDILELAEVVRNLSLRDREKGLSTGEKQMFVKAKKILASELMYAKEMDEEATAEWLDGVLAGANETNGTTPKKTSASSGAKKSPAAASAAAPSKASSKKPSTAKAPAKKPAAKKATAAAR